jgi:hypothetical protein
MITATLIAQGARQRIDVLTADEPDALGAIRIVRGNVPNAIKAIIVGNDDLHTGFCGPMFDGSLLTGYSDLKAECQRVMRESWGCDWTGDAINVHDRYESPADYARLSA